MKDFFGLVWFDCFRGSVHQCVYKKRREEKKTKRTITIIVLVLGLVRCTLNGLLTLMVVVVVE